MTVEVQDFQNEVIEESKKRPVVVDFWAPWCGPCRFLGPVLEKLASDESAGWTLAKVNTDENPAVAQQYRISSIPAVKLFIDGEVKDEFVGALPEKQVRDWLDRAIPSEARQRMDAIESSIAGGQRDEAAAMLEAVLKDEPGNQEARLQLARLLTLSDPARAKELMNEVKGVDASLVPVSGAVQTLLRLMELDPASLEDGPAKQSYVEAIEALKQGDAETALKRLVDVVRHDRRYDNDGGRNASLALFTLLGDQDPMTRKGRQQLQMALF
jgi:putative thioredoxin